MVAPVALACLVLFTACVQTAPNPTASVAIPTATSSASPSVSTPEGPLLEGNAEENQAFFDRVNQDLIDSGVTLNGAAFVENLIAQGYPRGNMEVTPDTTAIGVDADNIVFSIRFGESCLLGQWGNIGYTSMVAGVLSTGRCLIGTARNA